MKAISVLGTASNVGKSWTVAALGAWLRRQGVRVAPFKAQNMSNNSFVTLEGGEIGRAQGAQAAACGLRGIAEMNPILLKPAGNSTSQLVLLGQAKEHIAARDYYQHIETLWETVAETLEFWESRTDVLLLEGAGSPVELNLMHRDLVNLRPIVHLQGRWLLVADIEKGGVFAQAVGTANLMPPEARSLGLGLIVNKFRGDLSLFSTAGKYFREHLPHLPYLGTLPYRDNLQPESEDSLCREAEEGGSGAAIAWIRFPFVSNSQDSQPWQLDQGVRTVWVKSVGELRAANPRAIVLPGSKNTLADLRWLKESGLAAEIQRLAAQRVPVVGICGGYQMLGNRIVDPTGGGGEVGEESGLGLLPMVTQFEATKSVTQAQAHSDNGETWNAYEIHMGQTDFHGPLTAEERGQPLVTITRPTGDRHPEGVKFNNVWGTYLHGLFESGTLRKQLAAIAKIPGYQRGTISWTDHQQQLYDAMAVLLEEYLDLDPIRHYLEL
ncbi:MAG: cobyric acid synthase [Cyanobacteria bacterium P01_C01_bin.89]